MSPRTPRSTIRDRLVARLETSALLGILCLALAACDRRDLQAAADSASSASVASITTAAPTVFREILAEEGPPPIDGWVFHDHHLGPFRERVSVAVSPSFGADGGQVRRAVAVIVEGGPPPSVRTRFGAIVEVDGAEPLRFRDPAILIEPIPNTWAGAKTDQDISVRFLP